MIDNLPDHEYLRMLAHWFEIQEIIGNHNGAQKDGNEVTEKLLEIAERLKNNVPDPDHSQ